MTNPFCVYMSNPCLLVEELLKRVYKLASITSAADNYRWTTDYSMEDICVLLLVRSVCRPRATSSDNEQQGLMGTNASSSSRDSARISNFEDIAGLGGADNGDEMSVETQLLWIEFMDGVSLLHSIDLTTATSPSLSVGLTEVCGCFCCVVMRLMVFDLNWFVG
jgi:hypothetical protein